MYCLAAVCRDAAAGADEHYQTDVRTERAKAMRKVDSNIKALLKCTTPYLLAVSHGESLAKMVHLRRALSSSIGENDAFVSICIPKPRLQECMCAQQHTCLRTTEMPMIVLKLL